MADRETIIGDVCGVDNCRSRRYHVGEEGFYICDEGHEHREIQLQGDDEDAVRTQGQRTRTQSRSGSEATEKVYKHFTGRKSFELFLHCYQLILWKQCHFLVKHKGFPEEFETIVRDLWTLRLQHLKDRVEDIATGVTSDSESQSQLFSSQSEDEEDAASTTTAASRTTRRKGTATPQIIDTLALCYLGTTLIRLPVLLSDLQSWASSGELLYHGSLKAIPADMRVRLKSEYHETLEPQTILTADALHAAVIDLALSYQTTIGIEIPPLNFVLLCFRCIKELSIPLNVYPAASKMAKLLGNDFKYPDSDTGRKLTPASWPMGQLAALMVISTKLLYPFDDIERHPTTATEPAAMVVNWLSWREARLVNKKSPTKATKKALSFTDAMKTSEADVMSMSRDQLDMYLDWYGKTWATDDVDQHERDADFRREIFAMFPVPKRESSDKPDASEINLTVERLKNSNSAVHFRDPAPVDSLVARPGSFYKQWRREEDIPENGKIFCEAVGELIGMSVKRLVRAVFYTERRLYKWAEDERATRQATPADETK